MGLQQEGGKMSEALTTALLYGTCLFIIVSIVALIATSYGYRKARKEEFEMEILVFIKKVERFLTEGYKYKKGSK